METTNRSAQGSIWRIDGQDRANPAQIFIQPVAIQQPLHLVCSFTYQGDDPEVLSRPALTSEIFLSKVIQALDAWSGPEPEPEHDAYRLMSALCIGSKLVMSGHGDTTSLSLSVYLSPNYELQSRYLSLDNLEALWDGKVKAPECLDFDRIAMLHRLDEGVSLVTCPDIERGSQHVAVFKACTKGIARMYHEIRVLLQLPPHPNVMSKPRYLVTRRMRSCRRPVVCGFIMDYHSGGTLENLIQKSSWEQVTSHERFKLAHQILAAVQHVHEQGHTYYSELKPDNVLISSARDAIIADFEQSANWIHWAPPPISQLQGPGDGGPKGTADREKEISWALSSTNPCTMPAGIHYSNRAEGYWKEFGLASKSQQENYMVYFLGKILWCIFEWADHRDSRLFRDDDDEPSPSGDLRNSVARNTLFPDFTGRTPRKLQYLIWLATRDSLEWGSKQCNCARTKMNMDICGNSGAACASSGPMEKINGISRPSLDLIKQVLKETELDLME